MITNNTIAGGGANSVLSTSVYLTFDGAVPGVMNRNQWNDGPVAGPPNPALFSVQVVPATALTYDYGGFVTWAQDAYSLGESSAAAPGPLIDGAT